jgi:hypothetical protein
MSHPYKLFMQCFCRQTHHIKTANKSFFCIALRFFTVYKSQGWTYAFGTTYRFHFNPLKRLITTRTASFDTKNSSIWKQCFFFVFPIFLTIKSYYFPLKLLLLMTQTIFSVSCDLKRCIGYRLVLVYKALVVFTLCCVVWLYTIFKQVS